MIITISDNIKQLHEDSGLTQTQLARKLGLTRSSVNAWEMGISIPSTQYLVELAQILSVSTDYLLGIEVKHMASLDNLTMRQREVLAQLLLYFEEENREKEG